MSLKINFSCEFCKENNLEYNEVIGFEYKYTNELVKVGPYDNSKVNKHLCRKCFADIYKVYNQSIIKGET